MITLKNFVKETLTQIVDEITEFADERGETGATVHPRLDSAANSKEWSDNGLVFAGWGQDGGVNYATLIDFDVAVSAEDSEAAKAGGGIRVVSMFKLDGSLESQTANSSISRVQFRLPLQTR